jgi:hypothetical protein
MKFLKKTRAAARKSIDYATKLVFGQSLLTAIAEDEKSAEIDRSIQANAAAGAGKRADKDRPPDSSRAGRDNTDPVPQSSRGFKTPANESEASAWLSNADRPGGRVADSRKNLLQPSFRQPAPSARSSRIPQRRLSPENELEAMKFVHEYMAAPASARTQGSPRYRAPPLSGRGVPGSARGEAKSGPTPRLEKSGSKRNVNVDSIRPPSQRRQ